MDNFAEIFYEEAMDLLINLESLLLELEDKPSDTNLINQTFRVLHTLKGSGSMFGFVQLSNFVHGIETVFDKIRDSKLLLTSETIKLTLQARDQMLVLVEADATGTMDTDEIDRLTEAFKAIAADSNKLDDKLDNIDNNESSNDIITSNNPIVDEETINPTADSLVDQKSIEFWHINFSPSKEFFLSGNRPSLILEELATLGNLSCVTNATKVSLLQTLEPENCFLSWDMLLKTNVDKNTILDAFMFVDDICEHIIEEVTSDYKLASFPLLPYKITEQTELSNNEANNSELDFTPTAKIESSKILPNAEIINEENITKETNSNRHPEDETTELATLSNENLPNNKISNRSTDIGNNSYEINTKPNVSKQADEENIRIDDLLSLLGDFVTLQARLSQIVEAKKDAEMLLISQEFKSLTVGLRENLLKMTMQPLSGLFDELLPLSNVFINKLEKNINVSFNSGKTKLDREVLEQIQEPIMGLIFNAIEHAFIDHSNSSTDNDVAKGNIHINAYSTSSEAIISIEDDGVGIDIQQVSKLTNNSSLQYDYIKKDDTELLRLLCLPEVTTSKDKTRGNGFFEIRKAIQKLRGSLHLSSSIGKGTSLTMRIPFNVSIVEGLMVKVSGSLFMLPLESIEECIELTLENRQKNYDKNVILVREHFVPYIYLREAFNIDGEAPKIQQIIITYTNGQRIGFVVDHVIAEYQGVVKDWGSFCNNIPGISGATIRGDGSVALIVDIATLVETSNTENAQDSNSI